MLNLIPTRPAHMAVLAAAAMGGPYAYFNAPGLMGGGGPAATLVSAGTAGFAAGGPVTNAAIRDLRQFARFDVTPGWVLATFPRVSTVLGNVQMDGLRVPVVTGTGPQDFAGVVDYYFDRHRVLRRIVLQGNCGDPGRIVATLMESYGMTAEPSLGGHLYTSRWNNRVTSVAVVQPAAVVQQGDELRRYSLYVEINQPSAEYGLSEQGEHLLQTAWQNLRWQ